MLSFVLVTSSRKGCYNLPLVTLEVQLLCAARFPEGWVVEQASDVSTKFVALGHSETAIVCEHIRRPEEPCRVCQSGLDI